MNKSLPSRPNLDHLRRQAKTLLAALEKGDAAALRTLREHLPAAAGFTDAQIRSAGLRLADAQSAVARQSGFASWPQLARHVEQLRALEGTWEFASLEIDGNTIPPAGLHSSRLLIDGDRFRMDSPGTEYEGVFNINVDSQPHQIDIEFVAGPEAGNWNYGIFRLEGDRLEICLDMTGKPAPTEFRTTAGSGRALETLRRVSKAQPAGVNGGTPPADAPPASTPTLCEAEFAYAESELTQRLQGEWKADKIVRDGVELPGMMLSTASRSAKKNELHIRVGGQTIIHALVRYDESTLPVAIDYLHLSGPAKGTVQLGIFEWRGDTACFCMGMPGGPRPTDFECSRGSGRTLSLWRIAKKK